MEFELFTQSGRTFSPPIRIWLSELKTALSGTSVSVETLALVCNNLSLITATLGDIGTARKICRVQCEFAAQLCQLESGTSMSSWVMYHQGRMNIVRLERAIAAKSFVLSVKKGIRAVKRDISLIGNDTARSTLIGIALGFLLELIKYHVRTGKLEAAVAEIDAFENAFGLSSNQSLLLSEIRISLLIKLEKCSDAEEVLALPIWYTGYLELAVRELYVFYVAKLKTGREQGRLRSSFVLESSRATSIDHSVYRLLIAYIENFAVYDPESRKKACVDRLRDLLTKNPDTIIINRLARYQLLDDRLIAAAKSNLKNRTLNSRLAMELASQLFCTLQRVA